MSRVRGSLNATISGKTHQVPCVIGAWAQCGGGHGGRVPHHFFRPRGENIPFHDRIFHFFSLGLAFGEVSKIKTKFVAFWVKSFSCYMVGRTKPSWC